MKKPTSKRPGAVRARAARTAAVTAPASPIAAEAAEASKKKTNIFQFAGEVRAEARKITWTSWKETWITSIMVAIMVVLTAIFFFVVDLGLGASIRGLLSFANPGQ
jgi:preprotein translocase subunit SecE